MRPREWLEPQSPEDAELRMALLDARVGPSAAQVEAVARRVAERAATLEALRQVPRARPRLVWQIVAGVGLSVMLGALLWPGLERAAEPRVTLPTNERAARPQPSTAAAADSPQPAAGPDRAQPVAAPPPPDRKPRAHLRPAAVSPVSPADEVALLQEARRALLAHPDAALGLAHRHQQQFPRGAFGEERASIEIEALWRLARYPEARREWRRFVHAHPRSPYRHRLERLWSGAAQEL